MADPPRSKSDWVGSALSLYEGRLLRYTTRLLGDPDRARDVVQDAFLQLCREDPVRLDGFLVPWLFTVCRNRDLAATGRGADAAGYRAEFIELVEKARLLAAEASEQPDDRP